MTDRPPAIPIAFHVEQPVVVRTIEGRLRLACSRAARGIGVLRIQAPARPSCRAAPELRAVEIERPTRPWRIGIDGLAGLLTIDRHGKILVGRSPAPGPAGELIAWLFLRVHR